MHKMRSKSKTQTLRTDIGEEFIHEVHRPVQKILLFVSAPIAVFVFSYSRWKIPGWQSLVPLVGVFLLVASWIIGHRFSKQGRNGASIACFIIPVSIQGSLVMMLFDGFGMAALWPMVVATVYGGFYSRRLMFLCGTAMIVAPIASVLVKHLELYPLVLVDPAYETLPLFLMSLSAGTVLGFLMRRSQTLSESVFRSLGSANREQKIVLNTIRNIQPDIDGAVREIKQISSKMAAQSVEQAAATAEISATMEFMKENAAVTASNAAETQTVSESTRTNSLKASERLKKIEKSFDGIVTMISAAAKDVTDLSKQIDRIEEILNFNRKTGEKIKVLSINAAIEADRAGDLGQGFSAVATEFREMIVDTERNLSHGSALLQTIRTQAKESSNAIIEGSNELSRYFDDLKKTGLSVEENTKRFYTTAKQVVEITRAARQQQESVIEMSATMDEIDRASFELKDSANVLLENVNRIVASQQQLEEVLEIG